MVACLISYAVNESRNCNGCNKPFQNGELLIKYDIVIPYHLSCIFHHIPLDNCSESEILISSQNTFISLENVNKYSNCHVDIAPAYLKKIREEFVKAREHKTSYFIPRVAQNAQEMCIEINCLENVNMPFTRKEIMLYYLNRPYHARCLAKSGKVIIDAKEIIGYDSLDTNGKNELDSLFKKNNIFSTEKNYISQHDCNDKDNFDYQPISKMPNYCGTNFTNDTSDWRLNLTGYSSSLRSSNHVIAPQFGYARINQMRFTETQSYPSTSKQTSSLVPQKPHQFKPPNDAFIRSTLEKFKIPVPALFSWTEVLYTEILATSFPAKTHLISSAENSFFKCLSCFLTGKEDYHFFIKAAAQSYFVLNFKTFGTINRIDFFKLEVTSNQFQQLYEFKELLNVHFNIICDWLKCRIGIYSTDNSLQKYGNWNEESHPILLMKNENGFYKPVLTLA